MDEFRDNLFSWIIENMGKVKHDFCQSGMPELKLANFDIELNMSEYEKIKPTAESVFQETIAELYDVDKEQVLPTTGGTEGISLGTVYLSRHSHVIDVPVPEYGPMFWVPESLGFKVRRFDPKEDTPDGKDHSLSTTFPNNPTGDQPVDRHLSNHLKENALSYVDETFMEFTFPGKPYTLFHENENLIVSTTLTKFFGGSPWRVGWMIASKEKIRELRMCRFLTTGSGARYSLYVAVKILEKRDKIQKKVKETLTANRNLLKKVMNDLGLKYSNPDRTTFTFVETQNESMKVAQNMLKNDLFVAPGKYFGVDKGYRLCFTSDTQTFTEDMEKLKEYYESAPNGQFV